VPLYALTPAKQALAVSEISALLVSQREGRDAFPPETVAADIIDRVLRRQLSADPVTIDVEGTPV
jgi:hypothetical protein